MKGYSAKEECCISITEWQDSFSIAGFCPLVMLLWQVYKKVILLEEVVPILSDTFQLVWPKTPVPVKKNILSAFGHINNFLYSCELKLFNYLGILLCIERKSERVLNLEKVQPPFCPICSVIHILITLFWVLQPNLQLVGNIAYLPLACIVAAATGVREGATKLS
jgi:hypothetical protein